MLFGPSGVTNEIHKCDDFAHDVDLKKNMSQTGVNRSLYIEQKQSPCNLAITCLVHFLPSLVLKCDCVFVKS